MNSSVLRFRDAVILNAAIIMLGVVFRLFRVIDSRFRKAIDSFTATYQFRSGGAARRLIFDGKRIRTRRGKCDSPDFEINFIDLAGALSYMAKYPNDLITLIMEDKIEQKGNLFYLYKFGYLCGLCEDTVARRMPVKKNAEQ